jgi:hypothetical protein
MTNPFVGAVIVVAGVIGYYIDYLFVRFLFRLGSGVAEWLGGPEIVGTGIGLLLTILLGTLILGIFVFSSIGIIIGYWMILGKPWGVPRRWRE